MINIEVAVNFLSILKSFKSKFINLNRWVKTVESKA
jgi:hypothetical protein